jgi:hypothetical protein
VNATDWITAIVAVIALALSLYNFYVQRKDKFPNLRLTSDYRRIEDKELSRRIYSCRVVNQGSVPTQVRAVRLLFENDRGVPFPESNIGKEHLFETEYCLPSQKRAGQKRAVVLPVTLQPFQSVRFAAWEDDLRITLERAGFRGGSAQFRVGVLDSLDKVHTVDDVAETNVPKPTEQL